MNIEIIITLLKILSVEIGELMIEISKCQNVIYE